MGCLFVLFTPINSPDFVWTIGLIDFIINVFVFVCFVVDLSRFGIIAVIINVLCCCLLLMYVSRFGIIAVIIQYTKCPNVL